MAPSLHCAAAALQLIQHLPHGPWGMDLRRAPDAQATVDTRATKVCYPCSFDEAGGSLASLPQLREFVASWQRVRTLGEAHFGKVYLARATPASPSVNLPEVFALKRMPRSAVLAGGPGLESAENEILAGLALKELELPYTAQCLFAAQDEDYFYLATEYCEHGELFSVLQGLVQKGQGGMPEAVLREIMQQVLQAVQALHEAGIAHRDVSLENILVSKTGSIRLIDFGQALTVCPPKNCQLKEAPGGADFWRDVAARDAESQEAAVRPCPRGLPGKLCYRAPELMAGVPYMATKVDAFACGVLLYTLALGSYPALGELFPPAEMNAERCRTLQPHLAAAGLLGRVSPGCVDLLEQLLAPRPAQRASVAEAAAHPWLVGTLSGLCAPMDVDEAGDI